MRARMVFSSGVSLVTRKPSSCAFITMLLLPARSLTSTRRRLPTSAGSMCSKLRATFCTALTCMPPLWANAVWPTHGCRGLCRKLAISSTNCESSRNWASDVSGTQRLLHLEGEVGDHAGQVAVAGALAVTVDGALHMRRARLDRGQRVGHPQPDVVMRVDAEARG